MNTIEFISRFNDIITYNVKVKIGGNKSKDVLYDEKNISYNNRKGRKYPYYKGQLTTYEDAVSMSLPIDIEVTDCIEAKYIGFEDDFQKVKLKNPIRYTNCRETKHIIRIIDDDHSQIGYTSLTLNPSGDIVSRYSSYQSKDKTHEITRMMEYELDDNNKLISFGVTSFIEQKNNIETELTLYENNGMVVSSSMSSKRLEEQETEYVSITDLTSDVNGEDVFYYNTRCYYNSFKEAVEHKYGSVADYILCDDLTRWKKKSRQAEEWKKNSQSLSEYRLYASNSFLEYVEDDENDLTKYIPGEYVGHLFTREEDSSTLYIRTKAEDFEQNTFFYYTKVDLTGCDPFVGANPLNEDQKRDENYFNRIKEVRGLEYVTQNIEDHEVLIWSREKEEQAKNKFNEIFIEPYRDIEKIKIGKILSKQK